MASAAGPGQSARLVRSRRAEELIQRLVRETDDYAASLGNK